ncbi:hypothetical protein GCM10027294_47420 [Marinactinospora endophytica]
MAQIGSTRRTRSWPNISEVEGVGGGAARTGHDRSARRADRCAPSRGLGQAAPGGQGGGFSAWTLVRRPAAERGGLTGVAKTGRVRCWVGKTAVFTAMDSPLDCTLAACVRGSGER